MSENGKLKEKLNEKVRHPFIFILIIGVLVLVILAGCFLWFMPRNVINGIIPGSPTAAPLQPTFAGIDDPAKMSEDLLALPVTHQEWTNIREDEKMNGLYFIPQDDAALAVYDIDPNDLAHEQFSFAHFNHIWVDTKASDFYMVINISGETVDLTNYYILVRNDSDAFANRAIFNCYEAKEVILKNAILTGTLLAPNADVTYENTYIYGQVYAKSTSGNIAYCKNILFDGYDALVDNLVPVEFKTLAVHQATLDALEKVDPMSYNKYTLNDKIVMSDIRKIKELDLSNLAITDLLGDLDYFKHITSLTLKNSFVKHVDLTGFTNLLSLDISDSAVDFTDLSLCPNLMSLLISGKNINDFDLSLVPNLVYLDCSNSNVNNESFKKIASLAGLNSLIISDNPSLTSIDFSAFGVMNQIDIADCPIQSVDLAKYKGTLNYLRCSNTSISSLDLKDFTFLKVLEAYGVRKIDLSNVSSATLKTFYHDEDAEIIGFVDPVTTPDDPEATPTADPSETPSETPEPTPETTPETTPTKGPKPHG